MSLHVVPYQLFRLHLSGIIIYLEVVLRNMEVLSNVIGHVRLFFGCVFLIISVFRLQIIISSRKRK